MRPLGENIKVARTNKGWTQGELANAVGVSSMAISRYESGNRTPRDSVARKLADVLDISLSELFFGITEDAFRQRLDAEQATYEQELEDRYLPGLTKTLVAVFNRLNDEGQLKALERLEELAEVPKYLAE